MRRSPRRPLILKRRKLPFQQDDQPAAPSHGEAEGPARLQGPSMTSSHGHFVPDGISITDHPTMPDVQVVVIPPTADLQSVIGALTARGKECGPRGPNKFILLSGSGSLGNGSFCQQSFKEEDFDDVCQPAKTAPMHTPQDVKPLAGNKLLNKELDCRPLDDSLTNMHWLGAVSADGRVSDSDLDDKKAIKENRNPHPQPSQVDVDVDAVLRNFESERPPYSFMTMIQFAINSRADRRMTLKEIYTWIEDRFPYFREVAKPGWKNSVRHNLSLHDMFTRETSLDGKTSYWNIRPEANRCLTLDQVYQPGSDPTSVAVPLMLFANHHQRLDPEAKNTASVSGISPYFHTVINVWEYEGTVQERKMKPLLPRTESYLIPVQLPLNPSVYGPPSSSSTPFPPSRPQQKANTPRGGKRVSIAPKVTHCDTTAVMLHTSIKEEIKEEPVSVSLVKEESVSEWLSPDTRQARPRREASRSRRKQRLVLPSHEEPVLLFPDSTFFDSGMASDASALPDARDSESEQRSALSAADSPCRAEYSFKTPVKSGCHLASSTPSRPAAGALAPESWRMTPVAKENRSLPDFSPIRTPSCPALTPQRHDYSNFSFCSSTPFKELPIFSSPRELLTSSCSRATDPLNTPPATRPPGCSRELLQAASAMPTGHSLAEGLVLDTMNDSLSKILVDISFTGLDDDDLGMTNISWSEFFPQLK